MHQKNDDKKNLNIIEIIVIMEHSENHNIKNI